MPDVNDHEGHDFELVYTAVDVTYGAYINNDGDVVTVGSANVDFGAEAGSYVWCADCGERIEPPEAGLADDWEAL